MPEINLLTLLNLVMKQVTLAGELLIAEWARPEGPRGEDDKAEVDVEIEWQLREALLQALHCDFWGEETGHVLTGHPWCWVIDPNDGTSDFLKGRKGSAISVGLLRNSVPVLGVVYAPVTEDRGPDCIAWAEGMLHLLRNGLTTTADLSQQPLTAGSVVMVSAAAVLKPELNTELCTPGQFLAMPSIAYRLARVAAGDGVCAVSLYPLSAHDVVAGHALLRGSGGVLLDQDAQPISYRTEADLVTVSQRCFGGSPQACITLQQRNWTAMLEAPLTTNENLAAD
ncbi:inositol monophosphatase family protein [Pseudomonas chlororaphis]|uniref:inositol monophosphatase family protein n=1 Tax=Pseudomonas chlororaphis TaxID=587753 RepID=UPI000F715D36|nr:inositol monophosphatase family protein [Pseudomonas chlororaphis]AZD48535.1 3'(2'),5'-bisphosphate nucleotidase [Pseudomonas chlororaphis subsp. aurantiaca]